MVEQPIHLDRVPQTMREPIRAYAGLVRDLIGVDTKALTLFGAVVAGTFDPDRHAARSILVVDRIDLVALQRLAEHGPQLGKTRIAAPLIMTPGYIRSSLDTFPLELIEIHQQHATVFGDDRFADLSFDDNNVRLQCERELKVLLMRMRQGLLAASGLETFMRALQVDVGEGLIRTLRGLLWLKGRRDAKPALQIVEEVEAIASRRLTGIRTALGSTEPYRWDAFEALYRDVEALGEIVDAW